MFPEVPPFPTHSKESPPEKERNHSEYLGEGMNLSQPAHVTVKAGVLACECMLKRRHLAEVFQILLPI